MSDADDRNQDYDDRICRPVAFIRFLDDGTVEKTFTIRGLGELVVIEYPAGPFVMIRLDKEDI